MTTHEDTTPKPRRWLRFSLPTIDIPNPQYHSFSIEISRPRREIGYAPANDFRCMADPVLEARRAAG